MTQEGSVQTLLDVDIAGEQHKCYFAFTLPEISTHSPEWFEKGLKLLVEAWRMQLYLNHRSVI